MDCSYRFISNTPVRTNSSISVYALIVLLGVVLTALATVLLRNTAQSGYRPPAATTTVNPDDLKAAQGGDASAQFRVGEALLRVAVHNKVNSDQAIRWLQSSAESGNTKAMLQLGKLYRSGVGVLQNYGQSAKWIQTAASRGDAEAMLELGRLYRDGIGFAKSNKNAYVWFNRAAAIHNLDAVREREEVARALTTDELKEAQDMSSEAETASSTSK